MVSGMRKSKHLIDELVAVNDCSRILFPLKVMHPEMIGSKGKMRLFFFIFFSSGGYKIPREEEVIIYIYMSWQLNF